MNRHWWTEPDWYARLCLVIRWHGFDGYERILLDDAERNKDKIDK
jgi:hypothetical protein